MSSAPTYEKLTPPTAGTRAVNQNGTTAGIAAPSARAQARLLGRLYRDQKIAAWQTTVRNAVEEAENALTALDRERADPGSRLRR